MSNSKRIAQRLRDLPRVGSKPIDDRITQLKGQGLHPLGLHGYPMAPLPKHITEAAIAACRENRTAPSYGLPELRQAVAAKLAKENGVHVNPDRGVLVTSGGMHALHVIMQTLIDPGDEVAMFSPNYFFGGLVKLAGGKPVYAPLEQRDGFALRVEALEEKLSPRTKLILLSTPVNPTGYVATGEDLAAIAKLALRRDLLVVSDESYERFIYDGLPHISIASLQGMSERTITIQTFTKRFAMPGWRLGYLASNARWVEPMRTVLEWTALSCNYVAQRAATAALNGPREWMNDVIGQCQRNRDLVVRAISQVEGICLVKPSGTPFIFPRFESFHPDASFVDYLVRELGIPSVLGEAFDAPGFLRIPFAGEESEAQKLGERLGQAVQQWRVASTGASARERV